MLEPEALGQHKDDLAVMLRDLRKRAGLTGERLAARCAMSQSKISKIETGKIIPSVVDVERILQELNAPSHVLADVTTLAKLANTEFHDVRSLLRKGLEKKQHEPTGMEIVTTDFMALQLDRLASLAYLPNIQLGVIPVTERPPRGPLNTFTVYDERLVTAETFTGAVLMRDSRDVAFHIDLFSRFSDIALFGDEARERLAEWATVFRH